MAGEETELRAFIDSINRPFITIADVTVNTTGAEFRDQAENPLSADAFFAAINPGDLIEVDGTETGSMTMDAEEVELED